MITVRVGEPPGGWGRPWPLVFELAGACEAPLVLVGGLMVQLHSLAAQVGELRPTDDIDVLVNLLGGETSIGPLVGVLMSSGFELAIPNSQSAPAHRFTRGREIVDVLVPDHTRPVPRLGGREVMAIDGGAQALGKLATFILEHDGEASTVLVPDALGALILKAAAHRSDPRDRDRHLRDAALLAAAIADPLAERQRLVGSDRKRLRYLAGQLQNEFSDPWQLLPEQPRQRGRDAIAILGADAG